MMDKGADINKVDYNGITYFFMAGQNSYSDIVQVLTRVPTSTKLGMS